jgi:hypothetical protein
MASTRPSPPWLKHAAGLAATTLVRHEKASGTKSRSDNLPPREISVKNPSKTKLNRYARKYMKILGMKGPLPVFRIVDHKVWTWLARTLVTPLTSRSLIEIQKAATIDENTLERIVAHEVIHHCIHSQTLPMTRLFNVLAPGLTDPHGKEFRALARLINKATKKPRFVTNDYNDKSFVTTPQANRVWILIIKRYPHPDADKEPCQLGFCWTDQPKGKKVKEALEKLSTLPNAAGKFIETANLDFIHGPRIEDQAIAVPFGSNSKKSLEALLKIYETTTAESLVMFFDNIQKSSASPLFN